MRRESSPRISISLVVSIAFHSVLLFLIGGVVLFPGYVTVTPLVASLNEQEIPEFIPPPEIEEVAEETGGGGSPEDANDYSAGPVTEEVTPINTDVITSTALDSTVLPTGQISGSISGLGSVGLGGSGSGGGLGSGSGKGIGRGSGSLFGMKVQANRLGLVLDATGSMASYLPDIVKQAEKQFKDADVICAFGATMSQHPQFRQSDDPAARHVRYIDRGLLPDLKPKELEKLRKQYLEITKRGWVLTLSQGIKKLANLEKAPDAIYVFSDFAEITFQDASSMDEVAELLASKNIALFAEVRRSKVTGNQKTGAPSPKEIPYLKRLEEICQATGGSYQLTIQ